MKIQIGLVLSALLALAGCATNDGYMAEHASNNVATPTAAPQRVDAVSDALGQKVDNMVASRRSVSNDVTR